MQLIEPGESRNLPVPWKPALLLAAILAGLLIWQVYEHRRITEWARTDLRNRTRDITNSLGVILRSQGPFGMIPQARLETALKDMVESDEVLGIAILNQDGVATAQAGQTEPPDNNLLRAQGERWDRDTVTFVNLVDLGMTWTDENNEAATPVILPPESVELDGGRKRGEPTHGDYPGPPPMGPPPEENLSAFMSRAQLDRLRALSDGHAATEAEVNEIIAMLPGFLDRKARGIIRQQLAGGALSEGKLRNALHEAFRGAGGAFMFRSPDSDPLFRRPPWITEERWDELRRSHSAHWFVLTLSQRVYQKQVSQDLWLRSLVFLAGFCATLAIGMAWRAIERTSQLRMRLLRATDMNTHLHEMNVAAAGLVHETKNPLNVVRGLAQMLANDGRAPEATRANALQITEEVDRVAGRLNQFIDYSRPLEVNLAPVLLNEIFESVCRILEGDRLERGVTIVLDGPRVIVEADEALLRQVVFNLLLNALQSSRESGRIVLQNMDAGHGLAAFEVRDDGPGIPETMRSDIFRPYFTASGSGSGLGLTIVRQIVFAHQWDIECASAPEGGACFHVSGLRILRED